MSIVTAADSGFYNVLRRKGLAVLIILIFLSCKEGTEVEFVVYNNSQLTIDSVVVETSGKDSKIKLVDIDPAFHKSDFLDMNNIAKIDGNYSVDIVVDSITYRNSIGYYTNGFPSERKIEITFSPDTIRYKSITD